MTSNRSEFTRRGLLAAAGSLAMASQVKADQAKFPGSYTPNAYYQPSDYEQHMFDDLSKPQVGVAISDEEKVAQIDAAPLIKKTVHKVFNNSPLINAPNDLCFTSTGSMLLVDQAKIFEVEPMTGQVIRTIQTEGKDLNGITIGDDGDYWITSTMAPVGETTPMTIKVDPQTGKTIMKFTTPGWGFYDSQQVRLPGGFGGHGIKWAGNGQYWIAVPASGHIFLIAAEANKIVRMIPAPVNRTQGLAIDGDVLWLCASEYFQIQKLNIRNGNILGKIQLDKVNDPQLYGLAIRGGQLWYCDASRGWICNLT